MALNGTGNHRASENGHQAKNVIADDVGGKQGPVPLLEICHRLIGVAGERGVRATEADCYQPAPEWICQDLLCCPHQEKTQEKAAGNVNYERSVGRCRITESRDDPANKVAEI